MLPSSASATNSTKPRDITVHILEFSKNQSVKTCSRINTLGSYTGIKKKEHDQFRKQKQILLRQKYFGAFRQKNFTYTMP